MQNIVGAYHESPWMLDSKSMSFLYQQIFSNGIADKGKSTHSDLVRTYAVAESGTTALNVKVNSTAFTVIGYESFSTTKCTDKRIEVDNLSIGT